MRQMRRTMALTIPDQSNKTPQTNAIGPKPATDAARDEYEAPEHDRRRNDPEEPRVFDGSIAF